MSKGSSEVREATKPVAQNVQEANSLSKKLRELYKSQDTLPKLIDADEIPQQSLEQYYIKLQIVLNQGSASEKQAAAHDKVVGEKQSVEIENIFSAVGESKEANKLLIVGAAGVGKTTLLHYMSYRWGKGDLWGDKFDYVFRVKLKELLDRDWQVRYGEKLGEDILGCFLHYCLGHDAKTKDIKPSDIINIVNKNKVLLLLDGYDEVVHLSGNRDYQEIMEAIDGYQNVIMSSRPNALNDQMREKFNRQVENQGLGFEGIKKYVEINFGGRGEERLKEDLTVLLTTNSQVAEMCQIPINLALVSLVWRDPKTRAELTSNDGFNLGKLYEEVVVWLGKRYLEKFTGKSHHEAQSIANEQIFLQPEMEFLTKVAHDSFVRTGKLVEKEVIKENLHSYKIELAKVNKWGLMKPEGESRKLLDTNYQFIHLTFQEYLTAYSLKQQLTNEQNKTEAAIFIGSHRNEPKYLMTLKFLTGLVTASEDQLLVTRFWEAVSCNVDGVLELGMEGKISLLMHLLAQSKSHRAQSESQKGFDPRIPNLEQMQGLIDKTIAEDFTKWTEQIVASGYLPPIVIKKVTSVLTTPLDKVQTKELMASIEVITALANRTEFGGKTVIFQQLVRLIKESKDWQLQKFALEKLALVVDASIGTEQLENGLELVTSLMNDKNLQFAANRTLIATVKAQPALGEQAVRLLKQILNDSKVSYWFKVAVASGLPEIAKAIPELTLQSFKLLQQVVKDSESNDKLKEIAANGLLEIMKFMPDKAQSFGFSQQVIEDLGSNGWLKNVAIRSLPEIVKAVPKFGFSGLELLRQVVNDSRVKSEVRQVATKSVAELVKVMPRLASESFDFFQQLASDYGTDLDVKQAAISSLPQIVKAAPELGYQSFKLLQQLVRNPKFNSDTKQVAIESLPKIVKVVPGLGEQVFALLQQVVNDSEVKTDVKQAVISGLPEMVQSVPSLASEGFDLVRKIISNSKSTDRLKGIAAQSLPKMVQSVPSLASEGFDLIHQMVNDPENSNRLKGIAAESLSEVVKAMPSLASKGLELIQQMINDPKSSNKLKGIMAKSLPEIVKAMPELVPQGMKLAQQIVDDHKAGVAPEVLSEIVKVLPSLVPLAINSVQQIINDPEAEYELKEAATNSLIEMVCVATFDESLTLLRDHSPKVRSAVKKGMLAKLKQSVDYKEISGLVSLIEQTNKSTEQDEQALSMIALKVLKNVANNISKEGIRWVNEHFDELLNIDATRIFLKTLFHQTLRDGKITEIESQFLIKAILKYGFTAVINPAAGKIIFEDVAYKLQENGEAMLKQIIGEILERSQDSLADQYKTHQPLFRNTGSALPVAAVDIYDGSIVDGGAFEHNQWQLWLLNLSDYNKSEPTKSFLLLEKRAEDGRHMIHKLEVQDGKLQNLELTELPQNVDSELRHKVFGDMAYVKTAPRYYGSVFKVSLQDGYKLIAHAKEQQPPAGANEYEIMSGMLASVAQSIGWHCAGWQEYSGQEECKIFDKVEAFKLASDKAEEVRRNSTIIKGQIKLTKKQEQIEGRVDKLESLQKEAAETVQTLKNTIQFSEAVQARDKEVLQNRIEEIAQRLSSLANQADLEKVITGMKGLLSEGEITKQRLAALEEDVDSMMDRQEQIEGRVNKLESLQKEATGTIEALKNVVNSSQTIKVKDKELLQNRIEEIAQRLSSLANQADLEKLITGMKGLVSEGQVTKQRLAALEDDIDTMLDKQGGNNIDVAMFTKILYDNPILNHPELLKSLLGSKLFSFDQLLNLSARLAPELLLSVVESGDNELLIGTLMSVNDSY